MVRRRVAATLFESDLAAPQDRKSGPRHLQGCRIGWKGVQMEAEGVLRILLPAARSPSSPPPELRPERRPGALKAYPDGGARSGGEAAPRRLGRRSRQAQRRRLMGRSGGRGVLGQTGRPFLIIPPKAKGVKEVYCCDTCCDTCTSYASTSNSLPPKFTRSLSAYLRDLFCTCCH